MHCLLPFVNETMNLSSLSSFSAARSQRAGSNDSGDGKIEGSMCTKYDDSLTGVCEYLFQFSKRLGHEEGA